jgi:hypothetical protein
MINQEKTIKAKSSAKRKLAAAIKISRTASAGIPGFLRKTTEMTALLDFNCYFCISTFNKKLFFH